MIPLATIPFPYKLLAGALAAIALALGGYLYGHHIEALAFDAYKAEQGAAAEKAEATAEANARVAEQAATQRLTAVTSTYQEQINALTQTRDSLTAAVDAGNQRLYVHVAGSAHAGVPQAAAGGPVDHADAVARLSPDTADELIALASRADGVAEQLAAAQQVIAQDRLTCNGSSQ